MTPSRRDRYRGALLGLAVGDAVGTTVEFRSRGSFEPLTDMVGGGPFRLPPGAWTDDTSMALCLGHSLLACSGFDPRDQMDRYVRWRDEGYMSHTGTCFDIGNTVARALDAYGTTGNPMSGSTAPRSAGNGSLMRLAPVVLYFATDSAAAVHYAAESSRTTHAALEAVDACRLLGLLLVRALDGFDKPAVLEDPGEQLAGREDRPLAPEIARIASGEYRGKDRSQIRGTGYAVESLEAALWCFAQTNCYRDAVLVAANLGDDADTTAAITGQLAGAHYGATGIPEAWRQKLTWGEQIRDMADQLHQASAPPDSR